jgi:hypothetical protein
MAAAFTMLFAKIAAVLGWIGKLWVAIFVAVWDVCKDAFSWLFEQVLKVAITALEALDLSSISQYTLSAGSLPAEVMNVLSLLGVGTAIGIITAAIGIRLAMQLIPFVRLGS